MLKTPENLSEINILTVHQLNQCARSLLEEAFSLIWIKGELSNVATPASGHIYFTLKDATAQIRCALFKGSSRHLDFTPKEGMAVLLRASVSIYTERGDYQLIVSQMEKWGVGALQQAYEALKAKLQAQGLFDSAYKKTLPKYPQHIGVITSPTGAAIQDILSVLKRRFPFARVTIYPTLVQGKAAAQSIAQAIHFANQTQQADVLILARGGGSLEDLWAFNEEIVAQAIFDSEIPLVSGIGHETDFTIADFVADVRAPTPSVAAETVTPDCVEVIQLFAHQSKRLTQAIQRQLQYASLKVDRLEKQLVHPKHRLEKAALQVAALKQQCYQFIKQYLQLLQHQFARQSAALHTLSPLATVSRGYAIVTQPETGQVIQSITQLTPGETLRTQLSDGSFDSQITRVRPQS